MFIWYGFVVGFMDAVTCSDSPGLGSFVRIALDVRYSRTFPQYQHYAVSTRI